MYSRRVGVRAMSARHEGVWIVRALKTGSQFHGALGEWRCPSTMSGDGLWSALAWGPQG